MTTVRLKNGTEIEADSVIRGSQYPVLHIYTHSINMVQATEIFSDTEACREITVITETVQQHLETTENGDHMVSEPVTTEKVYHDFTQLYSVQRATLLQTPEGTEILVWLQRPQIDYD